MLLAIAVAGCQSKTESDIHFHPGVPRRFFVTLVVSSGGTDLATVPFGTQLVGGSSTVTLRLRNTDQGTATDLDGTFTSGDLEFLGGSFPGTGGTCTSTLGGLGDCTMVVRYQPTTPSSLSATLTLSFNDPYGPASKTINFTGTAINPGILSVSDSPSYDFGDVLMDVGTEKAFTLTNTGSFDISDIQVTGLSAPFTIRGSYPGTCGTCTTDLAIGDSCTIAITYRPITATVHSDSFAIEFDNGLGTQTSTLNITGTAIDPDDIIPGPPDPDDFPPANICR